MNTLLALLAALGWSICGYIGNLIFEDVLGDQRIYETVIGLLFGPIWLICTLLLAILV